MYQEWKSPLFTSLQLSELCKEFFQTRDFQTELLKKGSNKLLLKIRISPINLTKTLTIESKGRKLRLTFPPPSHASDGLMRLGGLLVTGRAFKTGSEKEIFLDSLEQQFWEYLDSKLGNLTSLGVTGNASQEEK